MNLSIGVVRRERVQAFRLGMPGYLDTSEWRKERPLRYPIGWFDYGAEDEFAVGGQEKGEDGQGTDAPVSQASKLVRNLAVVLQPPLLAREDTEDVLTWPAPLLPYQREGVMALMARRSLLLADSMGLGKTIQAVVALRILYHRNEIRSCLMVCPAGLLSQWRGELKRWAPELTAVTIEGASHLRGRLWKLPAHVKLIGYETLRGDVLDLFASPATEHTWDVVILDEASRIKNRHSGISVACKLLPRNRRWILTGTPVENRLDDAASLLDFLLQSPSQPKRSKDPLVPEVIESPKVVYDTPATLKAQLQANQLRRRREDVLPQLPPKRIHEITIELPPGQREAYDLAERTGIIQLTSSPGSVTIVHVLELISRLKQICNYDPASGESGKLADIEQRMHDLVEDGQRALIFSQFTDSVFGLGRIAESLKDYQPLVYSGALSQQRRAELVKRFVSQPEHKALLISLRAGSQGLNLQAASYVFHLDRWWNPAIEDQADSRAHRMGQTYPVTIYRYTCANTIEERIALKLRDKRQIFQEAVDDISINLASAMSESEIFGLLGLVRHGR